MSEVVQEEKQLRTLDVSTFRAFMRELDVSFFSFVPLFRWAFEGVIHAILLLLFLEDGGV